MRPLPVAVLLLLAGCVAPSAPGPTGGDGGEGGEGPPGSPPVHDGDDGASPPPPPLGAWTYLGSGLDGGRRAEGALDVARLGVLWEAALTGAPTGTPTVAEGRVYVGTWKGDVAAFDVEDGTEVWRVDAGAQVDASLTVWEDLVFFGDNKAVLRALDAGTGEEVWRVTVDATMSAHLYATPLVVQEGDGATLVMPVASDQESRSLHGDAPLDFRGQIVAYDARTGDEKWRTFLVPEGTTGAPVWGSAVYDADSRLVLFGTGNAYTEPATEMTDAAVALRLDDGEVAWYYQATKNDVFTQSNPISPDHDFGSTGALVDAGGKRLFVIGAKSSIVYAFDVATGELAWRNGQRKSGEGIIGDAAAKGDTVIVPYVTDKKVAAIDAATGETRWQHTFSGLGFADPVVVGDAVVTADTEGNVVALGLADGAVLWEGKVDGGVFGGLSVVDGRLFVPVVKDGFLGERGGLVAFEPGATGAVGGGGGAEEDANLVRAVDFAFAPEELTVPAGTPVTWRNDDPQGHTVTLVDDPEYMDLDLPAGARATFAFGESGTYRYYCKPHPHMVGTIVVT